MQQENKIKLTEYFEDIDDPREKLKSIRHKLVDIITIAVCAIISGAEGWNDIEQYGKQKKSFFKKFLELPNGIPSHDTFRRVFTLIDSTQFRKGFIKWVRTITKLAKGKIVAVDGKTVRRSHKDGESPIHIVSAWAQDNNVVLGQLKTKEKSNEITAIPELLDILDIKGSIITIDAMGCQKDIAEKIIEKEADYILALKGNQGNIHKEVKKIFENELEKVKYEFHEENTKGHGRIENRKCTSIILENQAIGLKEINKWKGLKSIVRIESQREYKNKISTETRYYISSLETNAKEFNESIRKHWSIENSLHWVLDVAFREDDSRIRTGNSAENLVILRHMALSLLKQEKSLKRGVKGKRLMAAWSDDYLLKVLGIS